MAYHFKRHVLTGWVFGIGDKLWCIAIGLGPASFFQSTCPIIKSIGEGDEDSSTRYTHMYFFWEKESQKSLQYFYQEVLEKWGWISSHSDSSFLYFCLTIPCGIRKAQSSKPLKVWILRCRHNWQKLHSIANYSERLEKHMSYSELYAG